MSLLVAGLMMESAVAMRAHTANEILPLIEERMQDLFLPQGIPLHAATQAQRFKQLPSA